jgi:hypothetical protein
MKGIKDLLSPFVKIGDDESEQTGTPPLTTPITPATSRTGSIKTSPTTRAVTVDTGLQKTLLEAVDAGTPPELISFLELVQSMADLGSMDEPTQYKSAFAAFQKTSKKGVEVLLNGIKKKLAALDTEAGNFDTELETSFTKIKKDRQSADDIQGQIKTLTSQISDLETKQKDLLAGAAQNEQDLNAQRTNFGHTLDSVKSIINEQESKIRTYLSPTSTTAATRTRGKQ